MENVFYLLNLTVSGIKSIKNDIRLDFYKKTVDKRFEPSKYRIKAVYGENGAGKSALVTAIKLAQDIVCKGNYLSEEANQIFLREIINKETKKFKFNCEFVVERNSERRIYSYTNHLSLNASEAYELSYEKLMMRSGNYSKSTYQTVFESYNGIITEIDLKGEEKKAFIEDTKNLLNAQSLLLLWLTKFDLEKQMDYNTLKFSNNMFNSLLFVFTIKVYLEEPDQHERYSLRKWIRNLDVHSLDSSAYAALENLNAFSSVNEKRVEIANFDKYEESVRQLTQFIKVFKPELESIDIDKKIDGDWYVCELILNYGHCKVNKEFESTGIKKLIRLFDCFLAVGKGGVVFIDEMDSNLNDVYLCKLIEYFMYYGKGQLCFTTHNLDPMMILKENKKSIDFLSSDNNVVSWVSRGNATPDNMFRNGMIEDLPFNVDATDFIGIFGE